MALIRWFTAALKPASLYPVYKVNLRPTTGLFIIKSESPNKAEDSER